jgi:hypothetical protein
MRMSKSAQLFLSLLAVVVVTPIGCAKPVTPPPPVPINRTYNISPGSRFELREPQLKESTPSPTSRPAADETVPVWSPRIAGLVQEISASRIHDNIEKLVSFGTRHTLSDTQSDWRGIGAARRWIQAEMDRYSAENGSRLQVEAQSFTAKSDDKRIFRDVEIVNVIATLPGTNKNSNRIYLVSGHYDTICSDFNDPECDAPGANDDASGVAAVMEMARVFAGCEFDSTIVFAAVAGEEQGLIGSRFLAKQYRMRNADIAGMFTNDIIGSSLGGNGVHDPHHVRVFSEGVPMAETADERKVRLTTGNENDSPARQLARYIDTMAELYVQQMDVVLIFRRDRFLRGGDHTSFSEQAYPAVRITEMNENYDHQHQTVRFDEGRQFGDLIEFVDVNYIADIARVNTAAIAGLALAPAPPANPRVITAKLENSTTLQWDMGKEQDLAGYEILWRQTTSPQWEFARFIGKTTSYPHPLSKDNYIFGVRSVDREGHRSVAVYPLPAKE